MSTKVHKLNLDKYGNIDNWSKKFFDEWDNKLDELLGI
jgi:predicted ATPase